MCVCVSVFGSLGACTLVPWIVSNTCTIEYANMAGRRRLDAHLKGIQVATGVRPFENMEMAPADGSGGHARLVRAPVCLGPHEHVQVTGFGRPCTHVMSPRAFHRACPLQHLQVSVFGSAHADPFVPQTHVYL